MGSLHLLVVGLGGVHMTKIFVELEMSKDFVQSNGGRTVNLCVCE